MPCLEPVPNTRRSCICLRMMAHSVTFSMTKNTFARSVLLLIGVVDDFTMIPEEERPKTTNLHRKPSSAWRKERRRDPIQSEALDMSAARVHHHHHHSRPSVIVPTTPQPGTTIEDTAVTPTPSLTPSAAAGGQRTGVRTVGGVSDPAIDEHFKRSLGLEEYAAVFNATTTDKEAGLSVDDHFAKALGETWTRLQATSRSKDST